MFSDRFLLKEKNTKKKFCSNNSGTVFIPIRLSVCVCQGLGLVHEKVLLTDTVVNFGAAYLDLIVKEKK